MRRWLIAPRHVKRHNIKCHVPQPHPHPYPAMIGFISIIVSIKVEREREKNESPFPLPLWQFFTINMVMCPCDWMAWIDVAEMDMPMIIILYCGQPDTNRIHRLECIYVTLHFTAHKLSTYSSHPIPLPCAIGRINGPWITIHKFPIHVTSVMSHVQ